MSWHTNVLVTFEVLDKKKLKDFARDYDCNPHHISGHFIQELQLIDVQYERLLVTWGKECNHLDLEKFIEVITLFVAGLYQEKALADYNNVIVFWEVEQAEKANCCELKFIDGKIHRTDHELPFSWGVW